MDHAAFRGECPGCGRAIESRAPYTVGGSGGQWISCRECGDRVWADRVTSDEDGHHRPLADGGRPVDDPGLPGSIATAGVLVVIGVCVPIAVAAFVLAILAVAGVVG